MRSQEVENLTTIIKKTSDKIGINASKKTSDKLDKEMGLLGFSYIGCGCDKVVYASPDKRYVVKFQIGEHNQIREEIHLYQELPKKAKHFYLKPIAYDHKEFKWVITRKAKVYEDGSLTFKAANEIESNLRKILKDMDVLIGINDLGIQNVGEINGKPIMIDYGWW